MFFLRSGVAERSVSVIRKKLLFVKVLRRCCGVSKIGLGGVIRIRAPTKQGKCGVLSLAFIELHTEKDNGAVLLNAEEIRAVTSYGGRTVVMFTFNDELRLYVRESYDEVKTKLLCGGSSGREKDGESGWGST